MRTNSMIAEATPEGFRLTGAEPVQGGVFVWAGGLKAPDIVMGSGLTVGHDGRVKVDQHLRALDHPEIYVAGDVASVVDPRSGHFLPPLAQIALEEAETVARNLNAELEERPLEAFTLHDKGFVVSVGTRRGVADIADITTGGRLLTFSRTPSSGSTANLSSTCADGTLWPSDCGLRRASRTKRQETGPSTDGV